MEEIKKGIRVLSKGKYYDSNQRLNEKELKGVFSEEESAKILEMLKSIMKFDPSGASHRLLPMSSPHPR